MLIIFQFFTFNFSLFLSFSYLCSQKSTNNDNETYEKGGSHDARCTYYRLM